MHNCGYFQSKYSRYCIMNVRQQRIEGVFLLRELAFVLFNCTNSIILRMICIEKSTMTNLLIDNNGITTELSTIICDTMWRKHIIMSSVDLLHELDVFTTRVKTKTVPVLGHSTSIIIVQHKSLRRNLIPCQQLLLIFLFFLYL